MFLFSSYWLKFISTFLICISLSLLYSRYVCHLFLWHHFLPTLLKLTFFVIRIFSFSHQILFTPTYHCFWGLLWCGPTVTLIRQLLAWFYISIHQLCFVSVDKWWFIFLQKGGKYNTHLIWEAFSHHISYYLDIPAWQFIYKYLYLGMNYVSCGNCLIQILISKTFMGRKLMRSFPFAKRARLNEVCMNGMEKISERNIQRKKEKMKKEEIKENKRK